MHFFKTLFTIFLMQITVVSLSFSEKVEISSVSMNAENMKKEVHFIGNVKIKQSENWIHSDNLIVYFDDNNETKKYVAMGTVTFEFRKEKSFYKGKAETVTYFPKKSQYLLEGKAVIDDKINKRHVAGNRIVFDMLTGSAKVQGNSSKPVKFIFDMEEKK